MTNFTRRTMIAAMIAAAATFSVGAHAAGAFPERTITMIVPFGPGGPTDVLARVVAEGMARDLGQPVIVENVPGAGGSLGSARAARAAPNGYTLLIGNTGTLAGSQGLFKRLPFDTTTDFVAIAAVGEAPQVLVARKDFPAKNLEELAAYAKANGNAINVATAGVGSGSFLGAVLVNAGIGAKMTTVNYRSTGQASADLIAGHVDLLVDSSTTAVQHVQRGSAKALAVLQTESIEQLPAVAGVTNPALQYRIWNMVLAPKGTDPTIVSRLNSSIRKTLENPAVVDRLVKVGVALPSKEQITPAGAQAFLHAEVKRWSQLARTAGQTID
jgi:tripartite-type tricarboxylate transporter receptor subunit TctC